MSRSGRIMVGNTPVALALFDDPAFTPEAASELLGIPIDDLLAWARGEALPYGIWLDRTFPRDG